VIPTAPKVSSKIRGLSALALMLFIGLGVWLFFANRPDSDDTQLAKQDASVETDPLEKKTFTVPDPDLGPNPPRPNVVNNDPWPAVAERKPRSQNVIPQTPESSNNVAENTNAAEQETGPRLGSVDAVVAAINAEVQGGIEDAEISPSPTASDQEWLRRVYLDLVGQIPSAESVEEFLGDRRENKRALVVNELLSDPAYVRNFATVWTNLLVGRSTERDVDRDAVHRYMRESFGRNRPWSKVVTDLVAAEGPAEENGASGFLLAHLNNEAVPATAITARLFLCTQVQCTQCHKHPLNDSRQNEFWELNSFFKQTAIERRRVKEPSGQSRVTEVLVSKPQGGPTLRRTAPRQRRSPNRESGSRDLRGWPDYRT
jgi:hypothetical protein